MNDHQKLIGWILKVAVASLASIMFVVVGVLMVGIFLPNEQIDNKDILAIIGPAFNTVIGAFVGLLGGLSISSNSANTPEVTPEYVAPEEDPIAPEPELLTETSPEASRKSR